MSEKKGMVEKERVVCQNCRYQYSYLYEAKEPVPKAQPTLVGSLENYKNRRESFRACPHCGFHQDWMIQARRRHRMIDLLLVSLVGAAGVLLYFVYQMITVAINPLGNGGFAPVWQAQWILVGYAGVVAIAAAAYKAYLHWIWNPNEDVDTESYEASMPHEVCPEDAISAASQYEAAARKVAEVELPESPQVHPWAMLSMTKKLIILAGMIAGAGTLIAPAMSPDLACTLAQRGMTMLPFYMGVVFMLTSALCGSWQFIDQKLR